MTSKNTRNLIIVITIVVVLILLGLFGYDFRGYGMMAGYAVGNMLFGWIFSILILILLLVGIYWLIKNMNYRDRRKQHGKIK